MFEETKDWLYVSDTLGVLAFLKANNIRMATIARETAKAISAVSNTVYGRRTDRKVAHYLLSIGVPEHCFDIKPPKWFLAQKARMPLKEYLLLQKEGGIDKSEKEEVLFFKEQQNTEMKLIEYAPVEKSQQDTMEMCYFESGLSLEEFLGDYFK